MSHNCVLFFCMFVTVAVKVYLSHYSQRDLTTFIRSRQP